MTTWSNTIPTEPGYYWVSYLHQGKWSEPDIVKFEMFAGDLCQVVCTSDSGDYEPVKDYWFGDFRICKIDRPE